MEYTCIIGSAFGSDESDGVVNRTSADLNYVNGFANRQVESFQISGLFSDNTSHVTITNNIEYLIRGLDEPDNYQHSYEIKVGEQYVGYITKQGKGSYEKDYDDYLFESDGINKLILKVVQAAHKDFKFSILTQDGTVKIMEYQPPYKSAGESPEIILPKGRYLLELEAIPLTTDEHIPYTFLLDKAETIVGITEIDDPSLSIFPNPTARYVEIRSDQERFVFYKVVDALGRITQSGKLTDNRIDLNGLVSQKYLIQLFNEDGLFISKWVYKG